MGIFEEVPFRIWSLPLPRQRQSGHPDEGRTLGESRECQLGLLSVQGQERYVSEECQSGVKGTAYL